MNEDNANARATQKAPATPELLTNQLDVPVHLEGQYRGCPAFLIGGGPSFLAVDRAQLMLPGCLTMAMNNAVKSVRPDLWVCVDDPSHFLRSIWFDPKIMKFVPLDHAGKPVFDSDAWKFTAKIVGECPNTFFYKRNDQFNHATYLTEDGISWGNHRRAGGGRSVMLPALRILYYLGVREVFLLGVDFRMDPDHMYHFAQNRHRAIMDANRRTYEEMEKRFQRLKPVFEQAGFQVYNCNPDSHLSAFPYLDFEKAVCRCRRQLPDDLAAERSDGLYDQNKGRDRKPPERSPQPLPPPPPLLSPPRIVPGKLAGMPSPETVPGPSRGVIVGTDAHTEWMLSWWFENYSKFNNIPVTFVDYGMSPEGRKWCQAHGRYRRLPRRYPQMPHCWFYKPLLFLLCDADVILALDIDCEVRGCIDPVFELDTSHPLAAKDPWIFPAYRHLFQKEFYFNSGVLCARKDDPLILEWGRLTLEKHAEFRGDQELFNLALYQMPQARVTEIPEKFNRLRINGDDPSAVIMHWTGDAGKKHIREMIARRGSAPLTRPIEFIQVGANRGNTRTDHVFPLIQSGELSAGVLIEPVPYLFEQLKKTYASFSDMRFENVAIDETPGLRTLYRVDETKVASRSPWWAEELGSFSRSLVESHAVSFRHGEIPIVEEQVVCQTFDYLLDKYAIGSLKLLAIDTEGHDACLIMAFPFSRVRPRRIIFEHKHLSIEDKTRCEDHLRALGYRVRVVGIDTVAEMPETATLRVKSPAPTHRAQNGTRTAYTISEAAFFVTCTELGRIGRLGNQFFRVAAVLGIGRKNGFSVRFPDWPVAGMLEQPPDGLFGSLPEDHKLPVFDLNKTPSGRFTYQDIRLTESTDFVGLFQSERWWKHCESEIRELFTLRNDYRVALLEQWSGLLAQEPISLHVRRGDYMKAANRFYLDPFESAFYERALRLLPPAAPIMVFSDDIEWCARSLFKDKPELRDRLFLVRQHETNNATPLDVPVINLNSDERTTRADVLDLFLMSSCAHHIVPNSTFSWWGAWLNPSPTKRIVTMNQWFTKTWSAKQGDISQRIPSTWLRI